VLKILLKAAILFLIVVSVYLIVNPHACSNMLAGRVRTLPADGEKVEWHHPMEETGQTISKPSENPAPVDEMLDDEFAPAPAAEDKKSTETATDKPADKPARLNYSQEDIDYAIASRYVELEREYAADDQLVGKDLSRKLSYTVMEDFEMTPQEWDDFLARATASGLFEKIRQEQPADKEKK